MVFPRGGAPCGSAYRLVAVLAGGHARAAPAAVHRRGREREEKERREEKKNAMP